MTCRPTMSEGKSVYTVAFSKTALEGMMIVQFNLYVRMKSDRSNWLKTLKEEDMREKLESSMLANHCMKSASLYVCVLVSRIPQSLCAMTFTLDNPQTSL